MGTSGGVCAEQRLAESRCSTGSNGDQCLRETVAGTDFAHKVVTILEETELAPRWLNLELTESALMDTYEKAPGTLERLDAMGIGTSIDDFGTGYSSLNYLRRFNFQTLKMDRCFVSDISTNKKAAVIVKGLISLAHNLGISVIAEGVERCDQLRLLAAENCDQVQGFLTGRR